MTLAESMAMAVIKGDIAAAYALADLLQEQREHPDSMAEQASAVHGESSRVTDGYQVYQWPEFRAFAKRLGFAWDLYTVDATIIVKEGEMVRIVQNYAGRDLGPQD